MNILTVLQIAQPREECVVVETHSAHADICVSVQVLGDGVYGDISAQFERPLKTVTVTHRNLFLSHSSVGYLTIQFWLLNINVVLAKLHSCPKATSKYAVKLGYNVIQGTAILHRY
jgi:hypothetical protein